MKARKTVLRAAGRPQLGPMRPQRAGPMRDRRKRRPKDARRKRQARYLAGEEDGPKA